MSNSSHFVTINFLLTHILNGLYLEGCSDDEFPCTRGGCIPLSQRCDSIQYFNVYEDYFHSSDSYYSDETVYSYSDAHCADASDEYACGEYAIVKILYNFSVFDVFKKTF